MQSLCKIAWELFRERKDDITLAMDFIPRRLNPKSLFSWHVNNEISLHLAVEGKVMYCYALPSAGSVLPTRAGRYEKKKLKCFLILTCVSKGCSGPNKRTIAWVDDMFHPLVLCALTCPGVALLLPHDWFSMGQPWLSSAACIVCQNMDKWNLSKNNFTL